MNARYDEIASAMPADLDALPRLRGFRLRGMEMTRLETFIDAAFAFAISMLVIAANQVPDNIEELLDAFRHVPAFVASVIVLGIFWRGHWKWSRRYGLEDGVSIFISWAMLATILIYIYPLSGFRVDVVSSQRRSSRPGTRGPERCASARPFRNLCYWIYGHRTGDRASESACLAIARPVTTE